MRKKENENRQKSESDNIYGCFTIHKMYEIDL